MLRNLIAWNHKGYKSPYPPFLINEIRWSEGIADSGLSLWADSDAFPNDGFDFFAVPMPQAQSSKIVFASHRDGNAEIYSMDADGSNQTRLTNNPYNDENPRWSPNGSKILFQSDRDNPETGKYDIYVMNPDGSGQARLTFDAADDCNAVWSADGSKIAFQSLRNAPYYQVYVMNVDGTSQVNLTNGIAADSQPSWSPDGTKIAFVSERDHVGRPSVYVMNANGASQTRLTFTSDPFGDEQPVWSRDGSKLAFVSIRNSIIETWQEIDDDGNILNRSRLLTNKEVYVMNADGLNQLRLTNTLETDDAPYWSPDGTKIIFRSDRERDCCDPTSQLWTMNADGSNQAVVSSNPYVDYSPSWTITGNQPPVANSGGPYTAMTGQSVQFNGSASFDPDGSITSYSWNFGDNTSGSGVAPSHAYTSVGTYTVTLTVTDNSGSQATTSTTATINPRTMDNYGANFSQWALLRQPNANELVYWNDIFRSAYQNGQGSLILATREFGRTVFESSEYAARNRSDRDYVYDLYKTYLMREPDQQGWDNWTLVVPSYGREHVRRGFDESAEFLNLMATLTATGTITSAASSLASARVDPKNQPGSALLARDAEWSLPVLSLPGRAGLDLGLSLSYSSMVWTRSGPYLYFDEDLGFPSPGFRLGFPTIQEKFFDAQVGKNVYVMITTSGRRVGLRQVGTSNVYEAGDSSYLQLIDNGSLLVRSTDGTQLTYGWYNHEFRCNQVKDRNGNYLTINYNWLGDITIITDTLGRVITFNYDANANPTSITQTWNGQTHEWATFGWGTHAMQSSFSGVSVVGAPNGSIIPVLTQVGLHDNTRYTFEYAAAGQLSVIRSFRSDNVQRAYTAYDYAITGGDSPRLVGTRVSALNWTSLYGVPAEVVTQYSVPGDGSHQKIAPDGTVYKEFYGGTGGSPAWQKGLLIQSEVWSAGVRQKWTTLNWTQDNTTVNYQTNPRVTESNVYDASGNRRRVTIDYGTYAQYGLPYLVREYAADGITEIRHNFTDYNLSQAYLDRRIIGLVSEIHVTDVAQWQAKITYGYDDPTRMQSLLAAATQHDQSYSASFTTRGNVTSVSRWDVTDITNATKALTTQLTYNAAGGVVSSADPLGHQSSVSYADSFSDGNNGRNTFAYPTTVTDAGGFSSSVQYNFDFGARTRVQGPPPANQPQGLIQTFTYDGAARFERVTTTNNGAYTRFVYGPDYVQSFTTVNTVADEAYAFQVFDGAGRLRVAGRNHPGSVGGYTAQENIYDSMGNSVRQSNPTEITGAWVPAGDDAVGWLYTQQTYDWQGRPLVITNTDGTTKEASYSGCGCAGGDVVTLTDEGTIDAGVFKRRQQRIYSDILGRLIKTESLNWQGGSVYLTVANTFNARDQITQVRQYVGAEGSSSYQDIINTYDGYGRLKTRHVPEQDPGTVTTWDYNADGTVERITDARGASQIPTYNARHLVTGITYAAPAGITATAPVSYGYDGARNRTSMTDSLGSVSYAYDQLSRMTSETRTFTNVGTFAINYGYNLMGQLNSVTDPWGATINYGFDAIGRMSGVTGSGYGSVSQFVTGAQYRAWGSLKSETYGNGVTESANYNARLQLTSFEVRQSNNQLAFSAAYQRYSNGRLKFSQTLDERFDRAFTYDHVGRIIEAYSGSEARDFVNGTQSGAPTGPYRQTYQYSPFNQVTQEIDRLWRSTDTTTSAFVNNRRVGWMYDADGRIMQAEAASYTHDAAGRIVQSAGGGANSTHKFDGDGRLAWTSLTTFYIHPITRTNYFLNSTVMSRLAIAEISSSGQKQKGYVYAGGRKIADASSTTVTWSHQDPMTGARGGSSTTGFYFAESEFNANGVDVGFEDPTLNEGGGEFEQPEPQWLGAGLGSQCSFSDPNCVTCYLDGIEFDCGRVSQLMASGAAEQCPNNDCGPRRVRDANGDPRLVPLQRNPNNGQLGYWPDGFNAPGVVHDAFGNPMRLSSDPSSTVVGGGTPIYGAFRVDVGDQIGEWEYYVVGYTAPLSLTTSINLQNPLPVLFPGIDAIKNRLNTGDCNAYIASLLAKASELYGKQGNVAVATDGLDLLSKIGSQGFVLKDFLQINGWPVGGTVTGSIAGNNTSAAGSATVMISTRFMYGNNPASIAMWQANYVTTAIHEMLHLAGRYAGYDDTQLATAASQLPEAGAGLPAAPTGPNDMKAIFANSGYYDSELKKHCGGK